MSTPQKSPEQRLLEATCSGHVNVLKELLRQGNLDINAQDDERAINFTVGDPFGLHDENYRDIVVPENIRGKAGNTALAWACRLHRHGAAVALMNAGADPKIANFYGETALHMVHGEMTQLIGKMVKAGADINAQNIWGATPLMVALYDGNMNVVTELLKHGANPALKTKCGHDAFDIIRGKQQEWPESAAVYEKLLQHLDRIVTEAKKEEKTATQKRSDEFRAAAEKKAGKLHQLSKTKKSIRIVPKSK
jgi:ankyrin repeat protein